MSEMDKKVLGGILGFMSFLFIMAFTGKSDIENEKPNLKTCYYCCQVIDKDADIVVNKTGIRWHADCYLKHLKEVNNNG